MKKIKNAFTLIELLAVIIILAIVALIATPIILNVIEDARISAGKSEANMILGGINNYCATEDVKYQLDNSYTRICTSEMDKDDVPTMVNLGNATIESIKYNGTKLTELVIKSNNHKFTLCSNGKFAMDDEECDSIAVITTGPIKDVILSNFPYLATNGNGCVTPTDNNYSYMGGCYIKGNDEEYFLAKKEFLKGDYYMTKDQIEKKFFDSVGNFSNESYDNYTMVENGKYTEQDLIDAGVETTFELDYNMKSEEVMKMTGKDIFYLLMNQMGMDNDTIQIFFDNDGNFIEEKFNELMTQDMTEDEINQQLQKDGVDTIFESFTMNKFGQPMTPEEFFGLTGKDILINILYARRTSMTQKQIEEKFFDNDGHFKSQEYENYMMEVAKLSGMTDEEINKKLQENGVNTFFEYDTLMDFGKSMTPEEYFGNGPLNNSIWYSGFLWRIMGINADGTVRLITDENVTAIPYHESSSNWDGSYAKDWLNNYFYPKLKGNNIIKEETWCSETTIDRSSKRTECTTNLSKEKSKVGLITIDEYNFAGGASSYLDIGQVQWTMTPYSSSRAWNVSNNGLSNYFDVSSTDGLRAVINVNSDVIITGGNGTLQATWSNQTGPYILNEDKNVEVAGKLNEKSTSGEYVLFAGKKYRVVDKDSNGNTKLILDGYYEETSGTTYNMKYGDNNTFSSTTGIGQKLNGDVLNWLTNNSDTEKGKLVSNYTWYQNNFVDGYDYKISLNEENPTRSINATVGLIRVGEMLSSQSSSILTNGYNDVSSMNNANRYWTMTSYTSSSSAWRVNNGGHAGNNYVSTTNGIRVVIVVNSDVTITSGNGTWSNPYQI